MIFHLKLWNQYTVHYFFKTTLCRNVSRYCTALILPFSISKRKNKNTLSRQLSANSKDSYNILMRFVCCCCFLGVIILSLWVCLSLVFWCPQAVGGTVVDANTLALGGIPTDLHMAGCLLWWLRVEAGGGGVFYHIPEHSLRSLSNVYTLSEQ